MANLLTIGRVLLIFLVIQVWARQETLGGSLLDLLMVPVLAWAIFMDALDGWAARRFKEESPAGALVDIAGDRIVELALWTYFALRRDPAGQPLVPYWIPLLMITRTVLTDLVRSVAFGRGRTPFGAQGLQEARWARQLAASRWSRALYGGLKAACFCALGLLLAMPGAGAAARLAVGALVYSTALFSLVRAVPVLWDGRHYLAPQPVAPPGG